MTPSSSARTTKLNWFTTVEKAGKENVWEEDPELHLGRVTFEMVPDVNVGQVAGDRVWSRSELGWRGELWSPQHQMVWKVWDWPRPPGGAAEMRPEGEGRRVCRETEKEPQERKGETRRA